MDFSGNTLTLPSRKSTWAQHVNQNPARPWDTIWQPIHFRVVSQSTHSTAVSCKSFFHFHMMWPMEAVQWCHFSSFFCSTYYTSGCISQAERAERRSMHNILFFFFFFLTYYVNSVVIPFLFIAYYIQTYHVKNVVSNELWQAHLFVAKMSMSFMQQKVK